MIEKIMEQVNSQWVIWSIIWLLVIVVITKIIRSILYRYLSDTQKYYKYGKRVYYIAGILYVIGLLLIWQGAGEYFATYIGFLSAGIAIALKEVFANTAAWLFILIRKPFAVGQRVIIGDQKGDVIDIRIFQFSLVEVAKAEKGGQSTGRIIDIPNYYIFIHPLVNYTKGFTYIWEELSVVLTFESDWRRAKNIFLETVNTHSIEITDEVKREFRDTARKYMIHYGTLTPIVYTNVVGNGVELTIRYLCPTKKIREINGLIWEDILDLVGVDPTIQLAYPTYTVKH